MARPVSRTVQDHRNYRDSDAARKKEFSKGARDITPIPPVKNPKRKTRCAKSFRKFCEDYYPETFVLKWSPDHLKVIKKVEAAVLHGGLFALAMPRGSGKTSVVESACVWALVYGHRDFVCLIGSDEAAAEQMLDSIKTELETNELLLEDFPEAVYPIHCLEGIPHRAGGQLCEGKRTHIGWTAKEIVLPTIPGSKASGGIVMVRGITGRLRGMKFKRPDGKSVRPSLVVLDDPQTDESAKSPSQCEYRESVLAGAILGLAGPGRKIAGIMPCTVIRPADMADRILNRDLHPEWNGERTKLIDAWPKAEKLWEEYGQVRADGLRAGDGGAAATAFYRGHRAEMNVGAQVAWPERHNPDELSALQHVMNLKLERGEDAFAAEFQNDPLPDDSRNSKDPSPEEIASRVNGLERYRIPAAAHHITAFIDVQMKALFTTVCAWEDDFTGYIVDYFAWPDPARPYYTLRDMKRTIEMEAKAAGIRSPGLEGAITHALGQVVGKLASRRFPRDDGTTATIERIVVDANWGDSTEVVYEFCQRSPHAGLLLPWHGKFIGGGSTPMAGWQKKRGDRIGHHWRIPVAAGRQARHIVADVNYWKSFVMRRLSTAIGDPGALTLWGKDPLSHRLFADHCNAEYRVEVEGRGRKVDEWKWKPERSDNHFWDGVVGNAVAASERGLSVGAGDGPKPARQRLKLSEIAAAKRGGKPRPAPVETPRPVDPPRPADPPPATPPPEPATSAPPPAAAQPGRIRLSEVWQQRRGR
jgi:hypothetical protein